MLDVDVSAGPAPSLVCDEVLCGVLQSRESTKAFFKDNGEFGFVTTITVKTVDGRLLPVTLWDACVKAVQGIGVGEAVTLQKVVRKSVNGSVEWHVQGEGSVQRADSRVDSGKGA
jgi:hypothetical protein